MKTRKLKRSAQALWLLLARADDGAVWLSRRPDSGIWAGLWCPPVFESRESLHVVAGPGALLTDGEPFKHVLTHKDLHLHPVRGVFKRDEFGKESGAWFASDQWPQLGLPAPVRKLLQAG